MQIRILIIGLTLLPGLLAQEPPPAAAPSTITQDQAKQILEELSVIRTAIAMIPRGGETVKKEPIVAKLDLIGVPYLGSKDAPVTMVEFTDYQCSYCRQFHTQTFPLFQQIFIDSGRVKFYSVDLPLTDIHPDAIRAAQAARCAGEQGKYWELRAAEQEHPEKLSLADIVATAAGLKLDTRQLRTCVESDKYLKAVNASIRLARGIGAQGTPSFILGKSTDVGTSGELIEGAMPYTDFIRAIAKLEPKPAGE